MQALVGYAKESGFGNDEEPLQMFKLWSDMVSCVSERPPRQKWESEPQAEEAGNRGTN